MEKKTYKFRNGKFYSLKTKSLNRRLDTVEEGISLLRGNYPE